MLYLGADLAGRAGLCYGRASTTPAVEVIQTPPCGDDLGKFGLFWWRTFYSLLNRLCDRLEPGEGILACYEGPVRIEPRWDPEKMKMVGGNTVTTTRRLQSHGVIFEAVCRLVAEERGVEIDCRECHLSTIKKEITGNGRADKSQLVLAARNAGISLPAGKAAFDGADSFGAWMLAVRLHGTREESAAWDRRIHGRSAPQQRLSAEQARKLFRGKS